MGLGRFSIMLLEHVTIGSERTNGSSSEALALALEKAGAGDGGKEFNSKVCCQG